MIKKTYLKPKIIRISIDNNISLVMMTNEGTPPGGPFGSKIKPSQSSHTNSPYNA